MEICKSFLYKKFKAPNSDKFINYLNQYTEKNIDNSVFRWGDKCKVDRIPLKWQDAINFVHPSLELLSVKLNRKFNYLFHDPWINLYSRNGFQEIHNHHGDDIVCVFFLNDGKNFSNFYFYDKLFEKKKIIHVKSGDIIFFSANLYHGVSKHGSDSIRKTFSANFKITNIV